MNAEAASTDPFDPEAELPRMSLPEHLHELRARVLRSVLAILVGTIVAFFFHDELWTFFSKPYFESAAASGVEEAKLQAIAPGEGFLGKLKICFLAGLMVVSPFVLWQMWGFIAAGLYEHERRWVQIFFPVSIVLFALGLVAAYILLIPFGLRFLISWDEGMAVGSNFSVAKYTSTCVTMLFAMGFVFQLPLLMLFLQGTGLVARKTLVEGWRWAVILSFVLGMMLTDPSPITQLMMAIPVTGLYFLGLWGGRFVGENSEDFRPWKAWPLLLGGLLFAALLFFADDLNDLVTGDASKKKPAAEGAPDPGENPPKDD